MIAPAPATEPTVSAVVMFSVAPLATLTTPVSIIAPPPVSERVPALTVVSLSYVLVPLKVSVPAPVLVTPPVPLSTLARVTSLLFVSNVASSAPKASRLADISRVVAFAHCKPPPLRVIFPLPKFSAAAKFISPPVMVVPPL